MAGLVPPLIPTLPFEAEGILGVPRSSNEPPARIVLIRLQAFGDTTGLLPVIGALATRWPECRIEVVTDVRSAPLFLARSDVARVHSFDARAGRIARGLALLRIARALRREPLDAILDLQRSSDSLRLVRWVNPPAWAGFDRFAPKNGLTRYFDALEWAGLGALPPRLAPCNRPEITAKARGLLSRSGRDESRALVCLNPAGGWETKQWPMERWIELGRRLVQVRNVELMAIGEGTLLPRFSELKSGLGPSLLDFSGQTTPDLAMALLSETSVIVSEDSGLMHLGWTQGVPAIALFGASRSIWSGPIGPGCSGFFSEDLPCGACLQPVCARGDLLCLNRVGVSEVLDRVSAALNVQERGVTR